MAAKEFETVESSDAKKTPKRVAFIKRSVRARVTIDAEEMVMTVPNLVVREVIAFEVLVIVLALLSLFFNAPLEWIANPQHTPNPAKAPWYFLGLQELLHYFPPIVAGVILPTLVVLALIVIPYFRVNVDDRGFWETDPKRRMMILLGSLAAVSVILFLYDVYAMLVPTWIIAGALIASYPGNRSTGVLNWLGTRSLSWWVMTWFVLVVVILTAIGTLFRGPEWSWTWPWKEIY